MRHSSLVISAAVAVSAILGASAAAAADLPQRLYTKGPAPVVPAASWTGLWVSGGVGYGLIDIDRSVTSFAAPGLVFDAGHTAGGRGWLGNIGVGGDYQFAGPLGTWAVGAFADAQWSDIKGHTTFFCPGGCAGPFEFNGAFKNDFSWAAGARLGYVALPGLLTYFNGGYTQAHFTQTNFNNSGTGVATGLVLPSHNRDGFFLGGGTEFSISQFPGLFWKTEYRYADYGNQDQNQVCVVTGACGVGGTAHSIDHSKAVVQTVTTSLVYRFNTGR
jgi:outer membrane immunogenic protein